MPPPVTLNAPQREAVRYLDGPCLVIAGAGSGKTRVIIHKIEHLIDSGIQPDRIGAITFTNKAASEMAERLKALVKMDSKRAPLVSTFHSLGVQMLRADGRAIGLKRAFSILDSDDAGAIVQQALATTDRKLVRNVQSRISLWKNALVEPDHAIKDAATDEELTAARVYREYAATVAAYQAVDFDDLIKLPLKLLTEHQEAREKWRAKIRYLLVDEYQDTNACQYELLKAIVGARGAFTAVGDDDQSIYAWRGASVENLARLPKDFPSLKVVKLEQNYRSTVRILQAANTLITNNPKLYEKKLWSEHGAGDPIQVLAMEDDEKEAESVVMRLSAHRFERQAQFRDYAILYRGNHQARAFEQALRRERIPYVMSGGQSFFERSEIKDLCAYFRLLANDDDDPAFIRAVGVPRRGVGVATLTTLGEYAAMRQVSMFAALFETGLESRLAPRQLAPLREFGEFINRLSYRAPKEPAAQVLDDLVSAISYRDHLADGHEERTAASKWANVVDFVEWVKKRATEDEKTLLEMAQTIALLTRLEGREDDQDAVRLSTLHASKGLEYPHVFLVGVEEGLLPHLGDSESADEVPPDRIEEERRLMYVGITRAQRSLHITWCRTRKRGRDGKVERQPSRFIGEIGLDDFKPGQANTEPPMSGKDRLAMLKAMLAAKGPV